jgi:PAS domain-containing protein
MASQFEASDASRDRAGECIRWRRKIRLRWDAECDAQTVYTAGLRCVGSPYRDAEDASFAGTTLLQISKLESELREVLVASESSLHQIINAIPGFVWSTRLDGEPEFYNQHYLEYLGISAEGLPDWDWRTEIHPNGSVLVM